MRSQAKRWGALGQRSAAQSFQQREVSAATPPCDSTVSSLYSRPPMPALSGPLNHSTIYETAGRAALRPRLLCRSPRQDPPIHQHAAQWGTLPPLPRALQVTHEEEEIGEEDVARVPPPGGTGSQPGQLLAWALVTPLHRPVCPTSQGAEPLPGGRT